MIATSVAYDLVFLVHILAAIATVIVLVAMRSAGMAIVHGADVATQRTWFPDWLARSLHVLPVTGLVMSLSGDSSVSLTKPWIGFGLLCYLAAAGHLEARTLPLEHVISDYVANHGVAPVERGREFVKSVDILLGLIALAIVAMLIQF
jgi:hypothetical protein